MHDLKSDGREIPASARGQARGQAEARHALADLESAIARLEESGDRNAHMLRRLAAEQSRFDDRLLAIEHGLFFRLMRALGGPLLRCIGAARRGPDPDAKYRLWLSEQREVDSVADGLAYQPVFTLLLSLDGVRQQDAERTLASIRNQTYPSWKLRIASGPAPGPESCWLLRIVGEDARIAVEAITFEQAIDAERESSQGDYVMIVRAGDTLAPSALAGMAASVQDRCADVVYTDEDCIEPDGQRRSPVFKPDWSPDLLARCMYLGGALAISRAALAENGWLSKGFGYQCEYDAALRLAEAGARFRHVPRVLYHRGPAPPPEEHEAGRRALLAAVRRREWQADVADGPFPLTYRLFRRPIGTPLVSIVVCSRTPRLVRALLKKLECRTAYQNCEVILVEHNVRFPEGMLRSRRPVGRVPYEGAFNFSRMNNLGVQAARGEVLVFLNDDVEPLNSDWLECLLAEVQRPSNGAVGARLLYPSGTIQHAGVAIGILDGAGHPGRGQLNPPFWKWAHLTRNVSAVTGACMAVRRAVFEEVGGFDEAFPSNYSDVDFCLRLRAAGYEVIYQAEAALCHYEAKSRQAVVRYVERERFFERWQKVLSGSDPFYSPKLTRDRDDVSLRAAGDE